MREGTLTDGSLFHPISIIFLPTLAYCALRKKCFIMTFQTSQVQVSPPSLLDLHCGRVLKKPKSIHQHHLPLTQPHLICACEVRYKRKQLTPSGDTRFLRHLTCTCQTRRRLHGLLCASHIALQSAHVPKSRVETAPPERSRMVSF